MPATFEEYWDTVGSRQDIADHKERARLAWEAGRAAHVTVNGYMKELIAHDVPPYTGVKREKE